MLDGPQVVRLLRRAQERGVVPVRLHGVRRDQDTVQRQRGQQRLEVGDLVGLARLCDPVLGDDQAGDVGDGGEQVHLLLPARLGELAFLPVHGDCLAGGHVPGITGHGRVQPGVQRVRPEPAVAALVPEAARGRRLPPPLPAVFLLLALLVPAVRGVRGRDCGIERGSGQGRRQRRLERVRRQELREPVQRRGRRRGPQPGRRADPAAVHGQHLLAPAGRSLRDRQRPGMPGCRPRHRHRHQRRQPVPDAPRLPQVRQLPLQRLPQQHRIRRRPGRQMAADALDKP